MYTLNDYPTVTTTRRNHEDNFLPSVRNHFQVPVVSLNCWSRWADQSVVLKISHISPKLRDKKGINISHRHGVRFLRKSKSPFTPSIRVDAAATLR